MAERRMFSKSVIESDIFLDMPLTAQLLYFHISMKADDDGFINNIKRTQKAVGCRRNDILTLEKNGFILCFESGVTVIRHWRIHNYIQKDRRKDTVYQKELSRLVQKDGVYNFLDDGLDTQRVQNAYISDTQDSIGKDSIGEESIGKESIEGVTAPNGGLAAPCMCKNGKAKRYGAYENVILNDKEYETLQKEFPHDLAERIELLSEYMASKGKSYKSHIATIRAWARRENGQVRTKEKEKEKNSYDRFMDELKKMRTEDIS
ncbi:MAG: replisome organizer [Ruminococcaceae bacterium]|nr:replisome organizer [Oscillospiraceae bacterium]